MIFFYGSGFVWKSSKPPNPMEVRRVRILFFDTYFYWFHCCFGSEQGQTCGVLPITKMFARNIFPDLRAKKHRAELIKSFLERHGFDDVHSPRSLDESLQLHYGVLNIFVPAEGRHFLWRGYNKAINHPWPGMAHTCLWLQRDPGPLIICTYLKFRTWICYFDVV